MMETILSPEALWFFIGIFVHKIWAVLFGYGRVAMFAQDVILYSLRLLVSLTEDVAYIRQLKYLQMKESGSTDKDVELARKIDEKTFDNWKGSIIYKFQNTYPRQLQGLVNFKTWTEALELLAKELKKRRL